MRPEQSNNSCKFVTIGNDHASFACSHVFIGEKRETSDITNAAGHLSMCHLPSKAVVSRADSVACVLNQKQLVFGAQGQKLVHATQIPTIVHDDDGSGVRSDQLRYLYRVDGRLRDADNVGEDRTRSTCNRHVCACDKVQRWLNNFVARPDTSSKQSEMKRSRRTGHGDCMLRLLHGGKLCLESLDLRAH